jgi:hypothetical protein
MGPVEREVRAALRSGGLTRAEARRFGSLGPVFFDRLAKWAAVSIDGNGRATLRERPRAAAAAPAPRIARPSDADRARAAAELRRRDLERAEQLRRLAACRTPEERTRVIEEGRVLVLAARALQHAAKAGPEALDLGLFGIDFDTTTTGA